MTLSEARHHALILLLILDDMLERWAGRAVYTFGETGETPVPQQEATL